MKLLKMMLPALLLYCFSMPGLAQSCGTCSWYGSNYPACCNQSTGWGWENSQSCVGPQECTNAGQTLSGSSSGGGGSSGGSCGTASNGYPICCSSSSDPDGDGWGWENSQSCVVQSGSSSSSSSSSSTSGGGSCGTASNGYPICCSSSSDPDGDGWGWENSQSCVVQSGSGGSSSGGSSSGSCPSSLSCPSGMNCGCYIVSGLGANKQAYVNAGADRRFLASAMMETEQMNTNYAYGDNKSGDAFNAGANKQNWGMIKTCAPGRFSGTDDAWNGMSSNSSSTRSADVQVYNACRNYYGNNWFAGHRNGSTGLSNPNTQDIQNFRNAYDWTYNQLSNHMSDDVRFWVDVPAI